MRDRMRLHTFSFALALRLWSKPHYRNPSFQHDIQANFSNVVLPSTGICLIYLTYNRLVTFLFLLFVYPVICLTAAISYWYGSAGTKLSPVDHIAKLYLQNLLCPEDWFAYWRLNSRLTAWDGFVQKAHDKTIETDYRFEDKWDFVSKGKERGVRVAPLLASNSKAIVIKHRNEEGGMGIHFYRNALFGGDWIFHEILNNSKFVASLLPNNAPLSTYRVITCAHATGNKIEALSCVFRAGRKGASTDHNAIPFDVDIRNSIFGLGRSNMHWYQTNPFSPMSRPYDNRTWRAHPDTGRELTDLKVLDLKAILSCAVTAHKNLCPTVPIVGWDVVHTSHSIKICLLEANMSCNFFLGTFSRKKYFRFVHEHFLRLSSQKKKNV
eukprot:g2576.t1